MELSLSVIKGGVLTDKAYREALRLFWRIKYALALGQHASFLGRTEF